MNEARYREAERRLWGATGTMPTEHRLRLERTGTTVRVQEVGTGPAVLFIHGATTSGSSWARLAARMTGFRCLLLDRPGTGLSDRLAQPLAVETLPAFAADLGIDVLDALGLETAHLVATSFGGYIALRTTSAHPERFHRQVLLSWPLGTPIERFPPLLRLMGAPGLARVAANLPVSKRSMRIVFRALGHGRNLEDGRITRADLDAYLALIRETDTIRNELAMGRAFIHPVRGLDRLLLPDSVLAAIRAPTLLLWGAKDLFGGESTARRLATRLQDAHLEMLPDAGHSPWFDDLDQVAAKTAEFLAYSGRRP